MSKEERSGRKGALANAQGSATIGDRGRICDSAQQFTAGLAGHIALPALSSTTENVGLWFERMEDYFELTETPPQKKMPLLKFYLDDTLRQVLPALGVSSSDDYESARSKLLSYLGGEKDPRIVRGQFFSRIQKAQEKTSAYMMELRRLSMSAFPQIAVKERDALVIDQFVRGLSSKAIKAAVVRARCKSAEEALQVATCEESDLHVIHEVTANVWSLETREQQPPGRSGAPAEISELADSVLDTMEQRSRTTSKQNSSGHGGIQHGTDKSVSKDMVCFNCGGRGHRKKDCSSPRTNAGIEWKNKDPVRKTGLSRPQRVMTVQRTSWPLKGITSPESIRIVPPGSENQRNKRGHNAKICPVSQRNAVVCEIAEKCLLRRTEAQDRPKTARNSAKVLQMELPRSVAAKGCVSGRRTMLFVDTGAAVSIVRKDLLYGLRLDQALRRTNVQVLSAGGNAIHVRGTINLGIRFDGAETIPHDLLVAENLTCPCLIGADFLRLHKCIIDLDKGVLKVSGRDIALMSVKDNGVSHSIDKPPCLMKQREKFGELIEPMLPEANNMGEVAKTHLQDLLWSAREVISTSEEDLGKTSLVKHRIKTGNVRPIKVPGRRMPFARRQEVQSFIERMLRQGIIEQACSPWSAPVVLVRKKDGGQRLCVDYRQLNAITEKDALPMPRIDDTLDMLRGARWFSTLDLASGYWQVEMHPADKQKTAFSTPDGSYQFRVMPFGLSNAPATFQRLMGNVLAGLLGTKCLVYLDDIIVFSTTEAEHLSRLKEVMGRIHAAGLKVKPSKCKLMRREVLYLGHVVSEKGIAVDETKCEAVTGWPTPRNDHELRQFLGLASYYGRFVKGFADLASPLYELLRKENRWEWSRTRENSFQVLKEALIGAPVLTLPDWQNPFILDVDASNDCLGAVLAQKMDDDEHPVAYASRTLSKPERNYCATRRELLALVWAVEQFRPYLYGVKFSVRTDHNCLIWLKNFKEPEGQVARWMERLAEFNMEIKHRPGKKHSNADAMSRRPCRQCANGPEHISQLNQGDDMVAAIVMNLGEVTRLEMEQSQRETSDMSTVMNWIRNASWPEQCPGGAGMELSSFWKQKHSLVVRDGLLCRVRQARAWKPETFQVIVPWKLRNNVLEMLHDSAAGGHFGAKRTLEKARQRFYWPGMKKDATLWCLRCHRCGARKCQKGRTPLVCIETGYPMQRVGMDFLGPFPSTRNENRYVLVIADYFTKWTEAYACSTMEVKEIAELLVSQFFTKFGPPDVIHTDQGRTFEASLMRNLFELFGIKKRGLPRTILSQMDWWKGLIGRC
uniref:RNA-directed DNA polymerase n=1 Tax=Trichuris muris TaxID=70415 RepID=A0A5S6QWK9_TRIMR